MCENLSQNQKIELVSIVKSLYFLPPSAQSLTYLCAPCTVTYTLLYFTKSVLCPMVQICRTLLDHLTLYQY